MQYKTKDSSNVNIIFRMCNALYNTNIFYVRCDMIDVRYKM